MLSIKGIMHYQTFNRSCSYAALANLIEDFNLNFEDKGNFKYQLCPKYGRK